MTQEHFRTAAPALAFEAVPSKPCIEVIREDLRALQERDEVAPLAVAIYKSRDS